MKLILPNVQGAWMVIHEPRAFNGEGTPSYSLTAIFDWDHEAVKLIEDAQDKIGLEKWSKSGKPSKKN
jgi:hypothetical protein